MTLIDADAFLKEFLLPYPQLHASVERAIELSREIDAEQVIRCKKCVFWGVIPFKKKRGYCLKYDHYARGKDYCAWAERKEE